MPLNYLLDNSEKGDILVKENFEGIGLQAMIPEGTPEGEKRRGRRK